MSKLIVFILKLICTILIIPIIGLMAILLSLILWDTEYVGYVLQFQDRIWNGLR